MPGDGHQKLTLGVEVKGATEGAGQLKAVDDAQKGVAQQTEGVAKGADKATEAQKKLSASESDFIGVLSRINPMLGGLVDSLFKSSKIAGDLASANINLTEVFGKATAVIRANAATLKLVGAGGAVALAVWAITRSVKAMREEFERATASIKAQVDALSELRGQEREQQQALENLADQRREGGYGSPDEARAAAQRVQQVGRAAPYLDQQAIMQAVALASAERSTADLERIALAIQTPGRLELEPGMRPEARERHIERALERHAEAIEKRVRLEDRQQRELYGEAAGQMRSGAGGSLDAIIKVVEEATRGEGLDPMRLAQAMQFLKEAKRTYEAQGGKHFGYSLAGWLNQQMTAAGVKLEGGKLTEKELATAENLSPLIRSQAETALLNRDTAELNKRAAEIQAARPSVIHNHNQFSRNTYPDATSQQRHVRNGENLARSRENL